MSVTVEIAKDAIHLCKGATCMSIIKFHVLKDNEVSEMPVTEAVAKSLGGIIYAYIDAGRLDAAKWELIINLYGVFISKRLRFTIIEQFIKGRDEKDDWI
jgi:hypothetical protein